MPEPIRTEEAILGDFTAAVAAVTAALQGVDPTSRSTAALRSKINGAFSQAKQDALRELQALRDARLQAAHQRATEDPVDHAERTAILLEAQQVASMHSTRTEARNKVLPDAWAALATGQLSRAITLQRALALHHIEDANLDTAIEDKKMQVYPNRTQASEMLDAARSAWSEGWAKVVLAESKVQQLLGRPEAVALAQVSLKMAEAVSAWQESRPIRSDEELGITYQDSGLKQKPGSNLLLQKPVQPVLERGLTREQIEGPAR